MVVRDACCDEDDGMGVLKGGTDENEDDDAVEDVVCKGVDEGDDVGVWEVVVGAVVGFEVV